jgi:N-acetylglucosaminyldiphosphoundecaprenol N-acetyl-beta-D-mannosaminyltransferase
MPITTKIISPVTSPLLGISIAIIDYETTVEWIETTVQARERGYICVAATHTIMACREDPELHAAVDNASFTVPDGQPLVWVLRLLGHKIKERVYGPELMLRACAKAADSGTKLFLYGGRSVEALATLRENLEARFPNLNIVGSYSPPFQPLTARTQTEIAARISDSEADVVWVGIGVPKQEKWMASMRPLLNAPVLIGVGAAFDFHAGLVPSAPRWMQRTGLEWAFRLAQEPRRLWRRYARYNPRFVAAVIPELLKSRARFPSKDNHVSS